MSEDPRIVEVALAWWQAAQEDLLGAQRTTGVASVCAFHAQQTVEKTIKMLLVLQ